MTNCTECMSAYTKSIRQGWGCGYEQPPPPNVPVMPWGGGQGYTGPEPTVCAGYTTTLPETIEIARAWKWWSKSQLDTFVDRELVAEPVKLGVDLLDCVVREFETWKTTPRDKGGGAD